MSMCISRAGEYSEHGAGDWCPRCGAFNETAVVTQRDALAREVEQLRAATVKPDRETVARVLAEDLHHFTTADSWGLISETGRNYWRKRADAVLDLLPGRTEAEVKAEAWREAADRIETFDGNELLRALVGINGGATALLEYVLTTLREEPEGGAS